MEETQNRHNQTETAQIRKTNVMECDYPMQDGEHDYKGFMMDFAIADKFGANEVLDTFKRCEEWKDNVEYWASLILTLNHRLWEHYNNGNMSMAVLYDRIWRKAQSWGYEHFKDDELLYLDRFLD